jgi:PIN domain nuclease of toxin-antitoxin system
MKYLLDTHIFIRWTLNHPGLSDRAAEIISDPDNLIYVSSASTWEIVIKSSVGKIVLPESPENFIWNQIDINDFNILNIKVAHTLGVLALPMIHKDPFDRILIAQAKSENMIIITDDALIKQYDVKVL